MHSTELFGSIAPRLDRSVAFRVARDAVRARDDVTIALPGLVRPLVTGALFEAAPATTLVVVAGEDAAERFARQLAAYAPRERVLRLPDRSAPPWSRDASEPDVVGRRARALHALEKGRPGLVVVSARALLRRLPPQGAQVYDPLVVREGDTLDLDEVSERLARMGYERLGAVEDRAQFAVRGGILDVFASDAAYPVRVELFGDEVESVASFVARTQQAIAAVGSMEAYPAVEVRLGVRAGRLAERALGERAREDAVLARDLELIGEEIYFAGVERYLSSLYHATGGIADYLRPDAAVVAVEPRSIFDDMARAYEDATERAALEGASVAEHFARPAEVDLGGHRRVTMLSLLRAGGAVDAEIAARRPDVTGGAAALVTGARSLIDSGMLVAMAVRDAPAAQRVTSALTDAGLAVRTAAGEPLERGVVNLVSADVPAGFVIPDAGLAILSFDDVVPRATRPAVSGSARPGEAVSLDFAPGDYVVHSTHGIARFAEITRKAVLGVERDYLLLEYASGDKLYVPFEQVGRVTKYIGPDAAAPRLTRLDTADWSRALGKARTTAKRLAFDLVDLYARRSTVTGHAFGPDTPWQAEMEAAFPFEETADQLAAIEAVRSAMEDDEPMDLLVAGDVGYGKTEVAVRAAFKAAQDGKQVMILCPTTVLAQQHMTTFSERFEAFPVRVEVLSRFRTKAQQRDSLEGFAAGTVDVLIGTHRLLSKDVVPKDLGLVVVDEEQRFGVEHKEHFKHLRAQVDVLTLSATPIPRTLQMALSGVRDLVVIDTPPPDRFPVKVSVGEYDPDLVQAAIRAELERGGQVYYIYNRVRDIERAVERVREAVPEARVGLGHGQMSEKELERVMESFSAGEYDVLVSTTIVESGLDNPHTNTLVIEDSQRLGLAQLYQLKGRVGRSHVRARAYFFFPKGSGLTEQATERLTAVGEMTELGSGLKLAMRDLEIRGAGNLLGGEQHGSMSAVGFELYAQMLREAVSDARGEPLPPEQDVRVDLPVSAFLPEDYVPAVDERVRYYRRLAAARSPEEVALVADELAARFGAPPTVVRDLLDVSRARALAADLGVEHVNSVRGRLSVRPLALGSKERGELAKRLDAIWVERERKLSVPLERARGEGTAETVSDAAAAFRALTVIAEVARSG